MTNAMIFACLAINVAVCIALGVLLLLSRVQKTSLQIQLRAAREEHRTKDSLLSAQSELDSLKDEFISTVSHELRTPLTSIRGALGLLSAGLMGNVDAKAQNLLRIASTNTDRLIRLINDILDLERMQSGRSPLQVRRCSLRELVQQAVETMTTMADAAQVHLQPTLDAPAEAVFFDGDPDRILQVLTNLLSNAIKFSPVLSAVQIRIEANADSVLLRVSDCGRGIPPDKLDSIFDRFQQVEVSDSRQKGGTGLGLAICRMIVQQHNGSIWAESNGLQNRGPGASLLVALPRINRLQDPASRPVSIVPIVGEGKLILCDDDPSIRTVVGEHLRQHGYTILEAERGEQAIELAENNDVAAILLDIYMPGMTGWDTLRRLRAMPTTAELPVIILSVLSPVGLTGTNAQIAASAQGWVQKPFNEHLLLAELSRVLYAKSEPGHVLLVQDDGDMAAVICEKLPEIEVRVMHAHTRQEAIERCTMSRPDLLILDLTLAGGNGFLLIEWLRQQPDLRSMPLIVLSGHVLSDSEKTQLRLGTTQFLIRPKSQPYSVEELVHTVAVCLRGPNEIPHRILQSPTEIIPSSDELMLDQQPPDGIDRRRTLPSPPSSSAPHTSHR